MNGRTKTKWLVSLQGSDGQMGDVEFEAWQKSGKTIEFHPVSVKLA